MVDLQNKEIRIQFSASDKVRMAEVLPTVGEGGFFYVEENIET